MVTVHIPWNEKLNSMPKWNQICASIVEKFGLPGDRYTTELTEDYMNFNFRDDRDGLLCKILVSEYV